MAITTPQTSLNIALSAASRLQRFAADNYIALDAVPTAEDWHDIADDFNALRVYANSKAAQAEAGL